MGVSIPKHKRNAKNFCSFDVYVKYVIYLFILRLRHYDADLVTAPTAVYIGIFCCFLWEF